MPIDLLAKPVDPVDSVSLDGLFDLDLSVSTEDIVNTTEFRSWSLCTPGCTSPGGGSNCSWCC
jgi:Gallidermin